MRVTEPTSRLARLSLALLLALNLLNYIDRYVLAAVEPDIRQAFFPAAIATGGPAREQLMASMAKTGALATAFLVSYMLAAPIFGILADRMSRWVLVGIAVAVWSLASGASGLAQTFALLVLTRCFVGIGEAGYGPAASTIIADLYPVERRERCSRGSTWRSRLERPGIARRQRGSAVGWRAPFFSWFLGLLLAGCCFFMPARPVGGARGGAAAAPGLRGRWRSRRTSSRRWDGRDDVRHRRLLVLMPAYLHDAVHAASRHRQHEVRTDHGRRGDHLHPGWRLAR